jgi:type III restriction enzyme
VKIQFDSKQQYQLDAVSAVVDIFDGQPLAALDFTTFIIEESLPCFRARHAPSSAWGTSFFYPPDKLLKNVRAVQERNNIEFADANAGLESWPLLGPNNEFLRHCYLFPLKWKPAPEKTYVYLRTIFELSKRLWL